VNQGRSKLLNDMPALSYTHEIDVGPDAQRVDDLADHLPVAEREARPHVVRHDFRL
jgi:hypothetical protein